MGGQLAWVASSLGNYVILDLSEAQAKIWKTGLRFGLRFHLRDRILKQSSWVL
jgi:hypothetical protein